MINQIKNISFIFTFFIFFTATSNLVNAQVVVDIAITEPDHHLAEVRVSFEKTSLETLDVQLPTWRTGRYEILNLANGIRKFSAIDQSGNTLSWQKTDKNTWQINNTKNKQVTVHYQVYANQLGKRTRHIDDSHAFLDASAVVMYTAQQRNKQHLINLNVPKGWRSATGLEQGNNNHQFIAKNYDVLVDSPIETGIQKVHHFKVDGREYELVIWGEGNYDEQQMAKDLAIIVKQAKYIWSDYPFSRYVFMVHATSGARGATEHLNSTIIQRSRYSFHKRDDYLGFLSTAAHEFVHTWNVKQYRPEGLFPYDYQQENYTSLLWVSEGSTSYLQNQLLLRGDLMTKKEFFKMLAKRITSYQHKPGRDLQSVAEASFDKWISQGGDYGQNHSVNIYSEGFLVSWMLDFSILSATDNKKSYRDVHNLLYKNYRLPHAFTEQDMLTILQQLTGQDYQDFWQQNVHGYAKPDFSKLLAKAGLKMFYSDDNKTKVFSGIKTKPHQNGLTVTAVEKDSPAWQAGLTVGDIIIAVDGLRIAHKQLDERLNDFDPEQAVKVTFFRRDQLTTKTVKLAAMPKAKLTIKVVDKPSKAQKAFFKAWTGLDLVN